MGVLRCGELVVHFERLVEICGLHKLERVQDDSGNIVSDLGLEGFAALLFIGVFE